MLEQLQFPLASSSEASAKKLLCTDSDHVWRRRLRSLQSVDELVAGLFDAVREKQAMASTVFIYASDHGYHSGQWGVAYCKMLPYEEDVRIPMFVRLPASAKHPAAAHARVIASPTLNIECVRLPSFLPLSGAAVLSCGGRPQHRADDA